MSAGLEHIVAVERAHARSATDRHDLPVQQAGVLQVGQSHQCGRLFAGTGIRDVPTQPRGGVPTQHGLLPLVECVTQFGPSVQG